MAVAGILFASILFGIAILVRPLGIVRPLFAALPIFLLPRISWRRSVSIALLAFAIPSFVPFAWMARNALGTGVWTLSTDGPIDLYYYKAAGVVWYRGDKNFEIVQKDFGRDLGWPAQSRNEVPPSLQPEMIRRTFQVIRNDPVAFLIMMLRSFGWLAIVPVRSRLDEFLGTNGGAESYSAATEHVTARIQEIVRSSLLTTLVVLQFLIMLFVWAGVARALASLGHMSALERILVLVPFILTVAFLGLSTGPESMARYRLPVIPLLAILAAAGWFGRFKIPV